MGSIVSAIVLALVLLAIMWRRRTLAPKSQRTAVEENPYEGLRQLALEVEASDINTTLDPFGVVMDWRLTGYVVTVVAMADGSASLYLSPGASVLGAGQDANVQAAVAAAIAIAAKLAPQVALSTDTTLPETEAARFYILTNDGRRVATLTQSEIEARATPVAELFDAMQEVLTQVRIVSERQEGD